jgi:hypothetical protein
MRIGKRIGKRLNVKEWDDRENQLIENFAIAMHILTRGSWSRADDETKNTFRIAAAFAVISLNRDGLDDLDLKLDMRGR